MKHIAHQTTRLNAQDDFLGSLYAGEIYILPANTTTISLINRAKADLQNAYSGTNLASLHDHEDDAAFLPAYKNLKTKLAEDKTYWQHLSTISAHLGFGPAQTAADPLRFRIALHEGYKNTKAAAAYSIHRDTWYANPQSQINVWIPLFDIQDTQGFKFYPAYFNRAVKNSSNLFNYNRWRESTGFGVAQQPTPEELYPSAKENIDAQDAASFLCPAGSLVVFSAAHLHGNCTNISGATRFSIDFRLVDIADHAARKGAPNTDNASRGCTFQDYRVLAKDATP